jgi:heptosyltransferase-2
MGAQNVPYAPDNGKVPTPGEAPLVGARRLVMFAPSWLGDTVQALPAIADVRRSAPGTPITIAARPSIAPLFALVPGADDVLTLHGRHVSRDAARLRERRFDAALLFPNSFRIAFVAWRGGIDERWGYRTDGRGLLLTRAFPPPGDVHQAVYYQRLAHEAGAQNGPLDPKLVATADSRRTGAELLARAGWDGRSPLVAMAPGAAYGGSKRWPARSFASVATALWGDGVTTVLVGSAADRPVAKEVASAAGKDVSTIDLVGTDLAVMAGILIHRRALVSNDSGAMHFAAALGLPVTGLFGPTDERVTRPVGEAHAVLTNPVWCRPCWLRECPLDHRCMRGIGVETVLTSVRRLL